MTFPTTLLSGAGDDPSGSAAGPKTKKKPKAGKKKATKKK